MREYPISVQFEEKPNLQQNNGRRKHSLTVTIQAVPELMERYGSIENITAVIKESLDQYMVRISECNDLDLQEPGFQKYISDLIDGIGMQLSSFLTEKVSDDADSKYSEDSLPLYCLAQAQKFFRGYMTDQYDDIVIGIQHEVMFFSHQSVRHDDTYGMASESITSVTATGYNKSQYPVRSTICLNISDLIKSVQESDPWLASVKKKQIPIGEVIYLANPSEKATLVQPSQVSQ